jgi:hypothetical protein
VTGSTSSDPILLLGQSSDNAIRSFQAFLDRSGEPHVLIDSPDGATFSVGIGNGTESQVCCRTADGVRITFRGILNRTSLYTVYRSFGEARLSDRDEVYVYGEWSAMFMAFMATTGCPVVNRPHPSSVRGVPYASFEVRAFAHACGLPVSDEYLTNDLGSLWAAAPASLGEEFHGSEPYHPRRIRRFATNQDLAVAICGTVVYDLLKAPTRCYVFAIFVDGWLRFSHEYDGVVHRNIDRRVPDHLCGECRALASRLGLSFAVFIFTRADDGNLSFVSVDACPPHEFYAGCEDEVNTRLLSLFSA